LLYRLIPNFARILVVRKYRIPVSTIPVERDTGNEMPFRNIHGITRNIGREGRTYQKVPSAWEAIFSVLVFSPYIQIMPRTEIRGRDAIRLPKIGSFLEISEMSTIIAAVRTSFIEYQSISG
jgi:hypothetical protein